MPLTEAEIDAANAAFPERAVEIDKAWKEMIHRYAATFLGLFVVIIGALSFARRNRPGERRRVLPYVLVPLVIAQGIFGALTVLWKVKPIIVTIHLLGGMTTLALLFWFALGELGWFQNVRSVSRTTLSRLAAVAMIALVFQILLGGWTSTNYAALACPDFPTCQGKAFPDADFAEGFTLWRGLDQDYEFGVLEAPARTAIHLTHRYWAIVASLALAVLAGWLLFRERAAALRGLGAGLFAALGAQVSLGILTVMWGLPLAVATTHNAGAALLLCVVVAVCVAASRAQPAARAA